jgi:membrane protease YdiL (CAAX protease family)
MLSCWSPVELALTAESLIQDQNCQKSELGMQGHDRLCGANSIGSAEAFAISVLTTASFVGVLYLPWNAGNRDLPKIAIARMLSVATIGLVGEVFLLLRRREQSLYGPTMTSALRAIASSGALTLLFYAGHFIARMSSSTTSARDKHSLLDASTRILAFRNYVVAPVVEEIVFRRQALLTWACTPELYQIFGPAALFSLAHLHHARTVGWGVVLVQLAYTLVFGVYATVLHVRTGSVFAPITAHVICNYLELPDFHAIANHQRWRIVVGFNLATILAAVLLLKPATAWARLGR